MNSTGSFQSLEKMEQQQKKMMEWINSVWFRKWEQLAYNENETRN